MAAGIVDRCRRDGFQAEPVQGIAERSPLFDQAADKLARRLDFVLEFSALASKSARMAAMSSEGDWIFSMMIRRNSIARSSERMLARARWP